ncbi:hypothetical protein SD71_00930 [Cohnella kolymensis]|uniref:Uncharacterized protein n=1 Tax=Cohnella kolymensis TaxID=1590652 RepID=A0ABR5A8G8_9BACL|nr:hypothetical protein [Cohnella kolymensis]KIL37294.1 hypothetical protein SD71_00930 [Cohnella kolymensis]
METLKEAPIDKLMDGHKQIVLDIHRRLMTGAVNFKDISILCRISQQNYSAFTPFQLSLILRVAEILFGDHDLQQSGAYIREEIQAAYGFYLP